MNYEERDECLYAFESIPSSYAKMEESFCFAETEKQHFPLDKKEKCFNLLIK